MARAHRRRATQRAAVLAAVGLTLTAAVGSAAPTVSVTPAAKLVAPGESFTMDVRVDSGADTLTCFLVEFVFDAEIIELVSAGEGSLFTNCGFATMWNWDVLAAGYHSCNDVVLGYTSYTLPPGELVNLEFLARAIGSTPVEVLLVDLRDYRRERILPVQTSGAVVSVAPSGGIGDWEGTVRPAAAAYPNPFGESTEVTVVWASEQPGRGAEAPGWCPLSRGAPLVSVYDVAGRLVACPAPRRADCSWSARWDGRAGTGAACAAGVYFAAFEWQGRSVTTPVVLVR